MNMFIVGGTFDRYGGGPSYIIEKIMRQVRSCGQTIGGYNGGDLDHLRQFVVSEDLQSVDCLLWMANIDNSEQKILPLIKKHHPHLVLIQSKRVIEKDYDNLAIVKRLLDSHSALGLVINKIDGEYVFSLIDPLGNCWVDQVDLYDVVPVIVQRAGEIVAMTRMRSRRIWRDREHIELPQQFIDAVRYLGGQFDQYVRAANPTRFLGNASTRCMHGFPSSRSSIGKIYVSKRNVDKTIISSEQFVEVELCGEHDGWKQRVPASVAYVGEDKPSVDTPVQLVLYHTYPNVNYMVHGHVYVEGAPYTQINVPCGFLEEIDEIVAVCPDLEASNFVVNLRGHGCLIMARDIEYLTSHQFVSRPFLEHQN